MLAPSHPLVHCVCQRWSGQDKDYQPLITARNHCPPHRNAAALPLVSKAIVILLKMYTRVHQDSFNLVPRHPDATQHSQTCVVAQLVYQHVGVSTGVSTVYQPGVSTGVSTLLKVIFLVEPLLSHQKEEPPRQLSHH